MAGQQRYAQRFLAKALPQLLKGLQGNAARMGVSVDNCLAFFLCWDKYQVRLDRLIEKTQRQYDLKAYDRLAWVGRALYKLHWGQFNLKTELRSKSGEPHNLLMTCGLLLGQLQRLSGEELLGFFDAVCSCRKENAHTLDALTKLRNRVRKRLLE